MRSSVELGATRKTRSRPVASLASIHGPASSGMRSGVMSPAPPAAARSRAKAVGAVAQDEVPVGHHQRRRAGVAHGAGGGEDVVDADTALERDVGRVGDDGVRP